MSTFKTFVPDTTDTSVSNVSQPETKKDNTSVEQNFEDIAPLDDVLGQPVLKALGIDDMVRNMPSEDADNLVEVDKYVRDIIKQRGLTETTGAFKQVLDDLKEDMGLDTNADPTKVLDRIGGVVKAWKNLTFIKDPAEKRRMFMKLARANSSSEMNRIVFESMEKMKVWQ